MHSCPVSQTSSPIIIKSCQRANVFAWRSEWYWLLPKKEREDALVSSSSFSVSTSHLSVSTSSLTSSLTSSRESQEFRCSKRYEKETSFLLLLMMRSFCFHCYLQIHVYIGYHWVPLSVIAFLSEVTDGVLLKCLSFTSLVLLWLDTRQQEMKGEQSRVKKEKKSERDRKKENLQETKAWKTGVGRRRESRLERGWEESGETEKMQSQEQRIPRDDMSTGKEGSNWKKTTQVKT